MPWRNGTTNKFSRLNNLISAHVFIIAFILLNLTDSLGGKEEMMQIDCEVTKVLNLNVVRKAATTWKWFPFPFSIKVKTLLGQYS